MQPAQTLSGIQVIEVAAYIPGPVCTQILADLGATVIKVERPNGGDPLRQMEPRAPDGSNPMFLAFNRGKQSVTLDLKSAEGKARLTELAAEADVLVDGFRPGVLERLGVGSTQLCARNPRLIYCGLSGYGANSPQRDVAGHDLNYVALSGFLAHTTVGGAPAIPGTPIADMISGLTAATAILAALHERNRTGKGGALDLAMSDAVLWLMQPWLAVQQSGLPVTSDGGNQLTGGLACYNLYPTADERYLVVAALEPHFWANFCKTIERPDLEAIQYDPDAQAMLRQAVGAIIAAEPLDVWVARFNGVDACVTPALTIEEAALLPLHRQRSLFPAAAPGLLLPIFRSLHDV